MSDTEENTKQENLQTMRQRYSKVADELTQELSSLQESYRQLGQRASILASERDTLHASLNEALQSGDSNKAELDALREEHDQVVNDLQARLTAEEEFQKSLRDEIVDLTRQCEEKVEAVAPLEDQILGLQSSVQKSLLREKKLLNERDTVSHKLEEADGKCTAAEEEKRVVAERLHKLQEEVEDSHNGYLGKIATLEERVVNVESERDEARQQVTELEAALFEHTSHQVEELEQALQQARSAVQEFGSVTATEPQAEADNQAENTDSPEEPCDERSEKSSIYPENAPAS